MNGATWTRQAPYHCVQRLASRRIDKLRYAQRTMNHSPPPSARSLAGGLALDPASATPLYLQVRQGLARMIRQGYFGADDALPSERALAEDLGISRVTARKALQALAQDGLVLRRHGSGNYVAPQLEQPLTRLASFTEELLQRGFVPGSRWLRRTVGAALPADLVGLGLSPGAQVARLERVRMADDTPMAYEASTLPITIVPRPEAVEHSLYAYLAERGTEPVRALQHIRAANATAAQAGLLAIPEGQALLFITRVGYLQDGRSIELTHTWCRSDFYDLVVELRR